MQCKISNGMKQQGFTLIEILIVIALVVVCSIVISDLFIGQNRIYRVETAELNIANDARNALDDVDNYVRQATRVLQDYFAYTTGPQILILQMRGESATGQILPGSYDVVVYYLDNGGLYRQVFPDALSHRDADFRKLANNVSSLVFTYDNVDFSLVRQVVTDITTEEDAGVQTRSITVSSSSILRNY